MKRATRSLQYIKCHACGKRVITGLAKKGICPSCRVGLVMKIHISDRSETERINWRTAHGEAH